MFDAPWIAPADIDTRRCGHIQCETRHEQVIVGRHGALDAFPSRRGVFPHAETCLRRMLHELIADHYLQRSRSRERAEALGHGDHLAEPVSASVTGHQVLLNGLFSLYDEAAQELGIEKIKTIGDCYMAVCGLPRPCAEHADRMARMALRMVEATRQYGEQVHVPLALRIGINSGPVVAGVIGTSKFIYDLWGDTVNLASRMESTGVPGQIQVTRAVYERLKDKYEFESRGMVQVKGKGEIETWLLQGALRPVEVSR